MSDNQNINDIQLPVLTIRGMLLQCATLQRYLATGSRTKNPLLLESAQRWAQKRIQDESSLVIVGDAWGVDEQIIYTFNKYKCERIWVFGWDNYVRHRTHHGTNFLLPYENPKDRNTFMIEATHPNYCYAFWDGHSHGTLDTITKARHAEILTIVRNLTTMRTIKTMTIDEFYQGDLK